MRYPFAFAPSLIAFTLLLNTAIAQQSTVPPTPQNTGTESEQRQPSVAPKQQRDADDTLKSDSGRAGAQEPSVAAAAKDEADKQVFVNGALNVPGAPTDSQTVGAPTDSQTVPAKFSKRNDALDKLPIMAWPIGLTDAQRRKIFDSVRASETPIAKFDAKITEELPGTVQLFELPQAIKSELPAMTDIKYLRLEDKVLLVYAPNWIVVDVIKN